MCLSRFVVFTSEKDDFLIDLILFTQLLCCSILLNNTAIKNVFTCWHSSHMYTLLEGEGVVLLGQRC